MIYDTNEEKYMSYLTESCRRKSRIVKIITSDEANHLSSRIRTCYSDGPLFQKKKKEYITIVRDKLCRVGMDVGEATMWMKCFHIATD
jgi:hypothetical protein